MEQGPSGQKLPFIFQLIRCGEDNQDLLFKRVRGQPTGTLDWALHLDIEDPTPATVLIFVQVTTPEDRIVDEVNKAQTFFREQVEPAYGKAVNTGSTDHPMLDGLERTYERGSPPEE